MALPVALRSGLKRFERRIDAVNLPMLAFTVFERRATEDKMSENSIDAIYDASIELQLLAEKISDGQSLETSDRQKLMELSSSIKAGMAEIRKAEAGDGVGPRIRDFLARHLFGQLEKEGIKSGKILEISGAWDKNFEQRAPGGFTFDYVQIGLKEGDPSVIVSDAINMDAISDETYVAVCSVSVMEHINKPWLAAREIQRVLKMGGVSIHYAPFSFPVHGSPGDFWRYTRTAFDEIFDGLEPAHSEFMAPSRRRNLRGTTPGGVFRHTTVDDPAFVDDAFGGWRDSWFTLHVAVKREERLARLKRIYTERLAIDAVNATFGKGYKGWASYEAASKIMETMSVDDEGRLFPRFSHHGITDALTPHQIKEIFTRNPRPTGSHHRFLLARNVPYPSS